MAIDCENRRYAVLQAVRDSDYVEKVYGGYFNVYVAAFGEEGDMWDLFRVYEGDFPEFNDLHKYDGFVITGSPSDAYGNDYWILKLCFILRIIVAMEKKLLGICFGHQVHQDEVYEVPVGAEVIASSEKTRVEMFAIGENILGIQGHPEYTRDILFNLIDRLLHMDVIQKGLAEDLKCRLESAEADKECWKMICRSFLKGK